MAVDSDTSILLVRHGATAETDAQRYPSVQDLPLSARGRHQATALAGTLQGVEFEAIFASPSQRARETAASLVNGRNLELRVVPELAEMGFGRLGGMSFAEAAQAFPTVVKRWIENPFEVTLPDGEPFLDFVGRVRRARRQLTREWAGHTIAVIAHGGVVAVWRCLEEGRPWSDFWLGVPAPGTGIWLIHADGQVRIETLRPEA
jgi:broad specificity phosphatase PhoE